jgi:beta-fructofuranosidase
VFRLPSSWVWDFWFADDGDLFHLFFLKASRALHDPDRRHWSATIGHAVSDDLRSWTEVADALVPSDGPAFDDLATWTGSVLQAPDGSWRMFYTGVDRAGTGLVQRIGVATSADLYTWHRADSAALTAPDPAWYEQLADGQWFDEAWRDPWVFPDPDGDGWHMLVTARANEGDRKDRGVVGHAHSDDLRTWTVGPPLSLPGAGFGQLEVLQVANVEGRGVLLFSCQTGEMSDARIARDSIGGIWAVNIDKLTGPYDIAAAYRLHDESLYVGRLVQDRSGQWVMLAFRNLAPGTGFVGEITDPMPVSWGPDGRLTLAQRGRGGGIRTRG